jgi:hypothetical protein
MKGRRASAWIAALTLVVVGAGVISASGSAGACGGTFRLELSSSTLGAIVSPDRRSITFTAPTIESSRADRSLFTFAIRSTGSMPARIRITQSLLPPPFASLLGPGPRPIADFTLRRNQARTFNAGIAWGELTNADLGRSVTITFTIRAVPA